MEKRKAITLVVVLLLVGGLIAAGYYAMRPQAAPSLDMAAVQAQMDAGQYSEAQAALEQIVEQDPQNAEAYFLLGLANFNLQQYPEARAAFSQALQLEPDRASAVHHNLGALAYQTGDLDTAVKEFKAALQAEPEDPDTLYQLGATYLVMALPQDAASPDPAMLSKAEGEFKEALQYDPQQAASMVGLGNVYLLQDRAADAIKILEQAVSAAPDMGEALFALGRAYAIAGQNEQAKETLQKFLKMNPPDVWAQQAQDILAQLGGTP